MAVSLLPASQGNARSEFERLKPAAIVAGRFQPELLHVSGNVGRGQSLAARACETSFKFVAAEILDVPPDVGGRVFRNGSFVRRLRKGARVGGQLRFILFGDSLFRIGELASVPFDSDRIQAEQLAGTVMVPTRPGTIATARKRFDSMSMRVVCRRA